MSDKYDTIILMTLGVVFVCVIWFGNRDIWRSSRRRFSAALQLKPRPATDWTLALAALMIVLVCCATALQRV
jgi:hypothetical protein